MPEGVLRDECLLGRPADFVFERLHASVSFRCAVRSIICCAYDRECSFPFPGSGHCCGPPRPPRVTAFAIQISFLVPLAPERLVRDRECLWGRPTDFVAKRLLACLVVASMCCVLYERTYHFEYVASGIFCWKRSNQVINARQEYVNGVGQFS